MPEQDQQFGGYDWAAKQLGVSKRTIVGYVKHGLISYVGLPPNGVSKRFYPEHIKEFKQRHTVKAKRARSY